MGVGKMILNNESYVNKKETSNEDINQEGGVVLNNKSEVKNNPYEPEKLKRKAQEQSDYSEYIWIPLFFLGLGYLDYNYSNIFLGAKDDEDDLDHTPFQHFEQYLSSNEHIKAKNKEYTLEEYIQTPRFSKEFAKVNEYICRLFPNDHGKNSYGEASCSVDISSLRGQPGNKLTYVEEQLDAIVDGGDLPIQQFTMKQIDDLKKNCPKPGNDKCNIKDTVSDALFLYRYFPDESIVQVASQFNAMESVGSFFSPFINWVTYDPSQGPRASGQAVDSAKQRESAYLKGKLPDMLKKLINEFKTKEKVKFSEYFYKEGYLQLFVEKQKNVLEKFSGFLKEKIGNLGFNAQWTLCGPRSKRQFQVFSAAPSFQGHSIDWDKDEGKEKNEIKQIFEVGTIHKPE